MYKATFSVSGTVTAGHAHSVTVTHPSVGSRTVSYSAVSSDTLNSIASGLASAVGADPVLGRKGIMAAASGSTVTLTVPYVVNGEVLPVVTTYVTAGPTTSISTPTVSVS